ncbi:MAG: LamG domain-containing protein [Methylococcaceae bacterium]
MNSVLSVQPMVDLVTAPYRRGAETLVIALGADVIIDKKVNTKIDNYDFNEYRARHNADPEEPKYVLFLKENLGSDLLEIEIDFSGGSQPVSFTIPPRSFAGTSFAIPLKANATVRLLRFRQRPLPLPGAGADNFGILALLGNIAKLFWVLGWEKDQIRQHLLDVQQQRSRAFAHGFSLDKLGEDLRVPRFPPREHSFDPDTIALYHLDDDIADNGVVLDQTIRFGLAGHPGINNGAQSGAIGKFGNGFAFSGPNGNGTITITNHADFDLPASQSFTVEAFVNADSIPSNDLVAHIIILKGQVDLTGTLTGAGWSLSVANLRGIGNNVRWAMFDGTQQIEIFADLNIADGRFHHLAGIIDRTSQRAGLFVDGDERTNADISAVGTLTNAEDIRIGLSAIGHSLSGVVDEVRFSKVARQDFHPVLGEGDEAYRQRLGIFERWLVPNPDALLAAINNLIHINGEAESFVLVEKDRPSAGASKLIRILPASLLAGQIIDSDGNSLTKEIGVTGAPEEDIDFNPIFLLTHNRPNVDYGANPNNHLMQSVTKARLDALEDLLAAASPPIAGNLIIDKAFDETDSGLHKVGRGVLLHHENLALDQLGVLNHRAGFDFVRNDGTHIYASVAAGDKLEIVVETSPPATGIDLFTDQSINLHVAPEALPSAGQIKWTLIGCGAGRAHFELYEQTALSGAIIDAATTSITITSVAGFPTTSPFKIRIDNEVMNVTAIAATTWTVTRGIDGTTAEPHILNALVILALRMPLTSRPHLRLVADAPGEITVRIEYTLQRRVVSGTRTIRIGIDTLADSATIAENGDMKISEAEAVGSMGETINSIYLVTSNELGVDYGADINNKKMQIVLESVFKKLLVTQPGLATGLQVLKAFDPADPGLHEAGRALLMTHTTVTADRLGALAHQAGFGFVRRQGTRIYCSVAAGDRIEIAHVGTLTPLEAELIVGTAVDLRVRFDALPGTGGFNWSFGQLNQGNGSFDFVLRPAVRFTPRHPGFVALNVSYLELDPNSTLPYTFEIKLNSQLEAANAIIPKHQYDLIMNILNFFHPIGVEVVTGNIRKHVVEVEQDPQKAFPAYTYPDFRV